MDAEVLDDEAFVGGEVGLRGIDVEPGAEAARPQNGRPIAASSSLARRIADCQRKFSCTMSVRPDASAAATMARASAIELAKGFWQIMCTSAPAASSTSGRWLGTVVAMSTKSSRSAASISAASA